MGIITTIIACGIQEEGAELYLEGRDAGRLAEVQQDVKATLGCTSLRCLSIPAHPVTANLMLQWFLGT